MWMAPKSALDGIFRYDLIHIKKPLFCKFGEFLQADLKISFEFN
jgi:hypothetical protein